MRCLFKVGSFNQDKEYPNVPVSYAVFSEFGGQIALVCPCKDTINNMVSIYDNWFVCKIYKVVDESDD